MDVIALAHVDARAYQRAARRALLGPPSDRGRLLLPWLEVPVTMGGLGMGLRAGAAAALELGRAGLRNIALEHGVVSDAVAAGAHHLAPAHDLPTAPPTVSLLPSSAGEATAIARPCPEGWCLTGSVTLAADPHGSDLPIWVPARSGREVLLLLVPSHQVHHADPAPPGEVRHLPLPRIMVPGDAAILTLGTGAFDDPDGVLARARIRQAAWLVGLGARCHAIAAHRARDRRQFGHPISRYQAISHPIAQARVDVRAAELVVRRAAAVADDVAPGGLGVWAARALGIAAEAAVLASRTALQTHGASGLRSESGLLEVHAAIRAHIFQTGAPDRVWVELASWSALLEADAAEGHVPATATPWRAG